MGIDLDHARNRKNGFIHPPIDPSTQLRLVTLEPARLQGRYAFNFHIVPFSNLDNVTYYALSYQWGTADSPEDIGLVSVGAQQFWIRRKLLEFTQDAFAWSQTREASLPFDCSIPLFIDAICINQLDPIEKACQIPKMADVYKSADECITYLGHPLCPHEDMQQQAHSMLQTLNSKLSSGPRGMIYGGPTTMSPSDVAQFFLLCSWTQEDLYAFGILCRNLYWTRMWIVPEVLLAPRRWTVVCGRQAFDGHSLAMFIPGLIAGEVELRGVEDMPGLISPEGVIGARQADDDLRRAIDALQGQAGYNMLKSRHSRNVSRRAELIAGDLAGCSSTAIEDGLPFYHAFDAFGHQGCSEKLDKVYALLPLLKQGAQAQIEVSYELDEWHAFEMALRLGWQDLQRDRLRECVAEDVNIGMMYSGYCSLLVELFQVSIFSRETARRIVRKVAWELDLRGNWRLCQIAFNGRTSLRTLGHVDIWLTLLERGYFSEEIALAFQTAIDDELPESSDLYRCLAVGVDSEVWSRASIVNYDAATRESIRQRTEKEVQKKEGKCK